MVAEEERELCHLITVESKQPIIALDRYSSFTGLKELLLGFSVSSTMFVLVSHHVYLCIVSFLSLFVRLPVLAGGYAVTYACW